ncbi:hypothetical protein HGRIS_010328 [Hohenbuehelia grisea]|uniref:F-box domain-containing protein n=1 Tax=Hohenbuehelia grisea TaxID=104357 RepID=A0ABR3J400_9AGAR
MLIVSIACSNHDIVLSAVRPTVWPEPVQRHLQPLGRTGPTTFCESLPVEIQCYIFTLCLTTTYNPVPWAKRPPLSLACVSRQWRHIVLATPRLWQAIHVRPHGYRSKRRGPEEHDAAIQRRMNGVSTWIARAARLPLSISLIAPRNYDEASLDGLLEVIFRVSAQWKSIGFVMPSSWLQRRNHFPDNHRPTSLESITVKFTGLFYWQNNFALTEILPWLHSPQLRHLSLYHCNAASFAPRLTGLTQLVLDGFIHEDFILPTNALRLLHCCPMLETCYLQLRQPREEDSPADKIELSVPESSISLPQLTRLCIRAATSDHELRRFYDALDCPRLVQFEVKKHWSSVNDICDSPTFLPMLVRSQSCITILVLASNFVHTVNALLLDSLRSIPTLKELHITEPSDRCTLPVEQALTNRFFAAFTIPDENANSEDVLCPALELLYAQPSRASNAAILRMIRSRRSLNMNSIGVARLQRVVVRIAREETHTVEQILGDAEEEELVELRKGGLYVYILDPFEPLPSRKPPSRWPVLGTWGEDVGSPDALEAWDML